MWKRILGEEIYSEIDFTECERLKEILWERRDIHLYQIYERTHNYYGGKIPEMNFENFYRFFIQVALEYAGNGELRRLLVIDEERKRVISDNILAGIANIPVRCLIEDIGKCREEKKLSGKNEREEYESYEEHFLKRPSYIKMLCRNYPEMLRLLLLRISQILAEIQRICKMLKEKNSSIQINDIKMGLSDSHTRGETAAKILLDNERWVIYKSRSLQKDRIYQNIYGWFCGKLKLSSREREILSNRECGIDAYIEQKPCVREEEIKRYFYRLGIQLFICYLSGTSDLHRENIIADGEYPELIDLETMPGAGKDSVMETGMLPVSCWGNTPIGLPVISNPKTSNIKLDYRQREVSAQDNILLCNGRWMAEEICIGFEDAYRTALGEREAINMLFEPLYREKSRYLFRHTQQYSMYLETSFSPYFMKDTINRILLLHVLKKKKTEDKQYRRVFAYEIEAMMDMEIPVYHFNGKSTYLKDGHGAKYGSFFVQSAYEDFQKKVDMLSFTDLKRQQMLIRLSAECGLPYGDENRYISTDFVKRDNDCEAEKIVLLRIIRHILDIQPKCDGKYMWTCLKFSGKDFRIEQAGMNLYDGVPGMAVLFASVLAVCRTGEYERVYRDLIEEMFHYTDGYTKEKGKNTLCGTGMFEGEGSIVFAYIILYRITGKKVFLQYARKHAGIVQKICRQDSRYDLISGNSGWIVVLLQLFRLTGEEQYLSFAVEAGKMKMSAEI